MVQVHASFDVAASVAEVENECVAAGLPSYIAMEVGESLYRWSDRARPSLIHVVAVRC